MAALALLLKQNNVAVLYIVQFLGEDIMPSDAKSFFASISSNLLNGIVQDDDDEEKVVDFLKPFHVVKNAKEIVFYFEVRKEQSSVTKGMHICLPTTCHLLGIPRHFG